MNDNSDVYYIDTNKKPDNYSSQELLDLASGRAKPKPKFREKSIDEQVEDINLVRFDIEDWENLCQAEDKINDAIKCVRAIRNSSSVDDRKKAAQEVLRAQSSQQAEGKWWEEYSCPADKLEYAQSGHWGSKIASNAEDYIEFVKENGMADQSGENKAHESVGINFDKKKASQQLENAGMDEKYVGMTADILELKNQGKELSDKQQNALAKAQEVVGDKLDIESVGQVEEQSEEPSSAGNGSFDKETASQQLENAGMDEKYVGMTADILELKNQGKELSDKQQNALAKAQEVIGDKLDIESVGQVEEQSEEPSSAGNGSFDKETASQQLSEEDKKAKERFLATQEKLKQETKAKEMGADISANAQDYMEYAKENGIAQQAGSAAIVQGEKYTVSQIEDRTAVFNTETGGEVITQGDKVINAEGIDEQDLENWRNVGNMLDEERGKKSLEEVEEEEEGIEM